MQKGMQILHPFLVVHLAAHVSNTNIRRFRRIRFRRHCIRHRITEEESASSSRFRRHCIRTVSYTHLTLPTKLEV